MIIRNKKTRIERYVSQEEWDAIRNHPQLRDRFVVVNAAEIKSAALEKRSPIVPKEVIDFKNRVISELKNESVKTKTKKPKGKK